MVNKRPRQAGAPKSVKASDNLRDTLREAIKSGNYWLADGPESGGLCKAYLDGHIAIGWRGSPRAKAEDRGLLIKVNRVAPNALHTLDEGDPGAGKAGAHVDQ